MTNFPFVGLSWASTESQFGARFYHVEPNKSYHYTIYKQSEAWMMQVTVPVHPLVLGVMILLLREKFK